MDCNILEQLASKLHRICIQESCSQFLVSPIPVYEIAREYEKAYFRGMAAFVLQHCDLDSIGRMLESG